MLKKVISIRMSPDELAKARDGLITKNIDPTQMDSLSQILRLTFYFGLMAICKDPKSSPTDESLAFVNQRINQKTVKGLSSLNDFITKK